jgi:hypothetical protein
MASVFPVIATLALLASLMQATAAASVTDADFSRSYVVWIAVDEGHCTFFMTDVGEDAAQLTQTLRENYHPRNGIEILTSADTPSRCVRKAQRAVRRAGFSHFRVRRGTDADRSPGIP